MGKFHKFLDRIHDHHQNKVDEKGPRIYRAQENTVTEQRTTTQPKKKQHHHHHHHGKSKKDPLIEEDFIQTQLYPQKVRQAEVHDMYHDPVIATSAPLDPNPILAPSNLHPTADVPDLYNPFISPPKMAPPLVPHNGLPQLSTVPLVRPSPISPTLVSPAPTPPVPPSPAMHYSPVPPMTPMYSPAYSPQIMFVAPFVAQPPMQVPMQVPAMPAVAPPPTLFTPPLLPQEMPVFSRFNAFATPTPYTMATVPPTTDLRPIPLPTPPPCAAPAPPAPSQTVRHVRPAPYKPPPVYHTSLLPSPTVPRQVATPAQPIPTQTNTHPHYTNHATEQWNPEIFINDFLRFKLNKESPSNPKIEDDDVRTPTESDSTTQVYASEEPDLDFTAPDEYDYSNCGYNYEYSDVTDYNDAPYDESTVTNTETYSYPSPPPSSPCFVKASPPAPPTTPIMQADEVVDSTAWAQDAVPASVTHASTKRAEPTPWYADQSPDNTYSRSRSYTSGLQNTSTTPQLTRESSAPSVLRTPFDEPTQVPKPAQALKPVQAPKLAQAPKPTQTSKPAPAPKPVQAPKQPAQVPKQPAQAPKQPAQVPKQPAQAPKQPAQVAKPAPSLPPPITTKSTSTSLPPPPSPVAVAPIATTLPPPPPPLPETSHIGMDAQGMNGPGRSLLLCDIRQGTKLRKIDVAEIQQKRRSADALTLHESPEFGLTKHLTTSLAFRRTVMSDGEDDDLGGSWD